MPNREERHDGGGGGGGGGGAAAAPASAAPLPQWSIEEATAMDFPACLEGIAQIVLDRDGEAQRALLRWERRDELERQDSRELTESWRLAALQCVLVAKELFEGDKRPAGASEAHRAIHRQVAQELKKMEATFQQAAEQEISDEKVHELMDTTGKDKIRCRQQLRMCGGDVNRAAGRLLHLADGDAETHELSSQTSDGSAGEVLSRQTSTASSEHTDEPEPGREPTSTLSSTAGVERQASRDDDDDDGGGGGQQQEQDEEAESPQPAPQPAVEESSTGPRSEEECCGANHAFYSNLHQIRSSHTHYGNGAVPQLPCLRLERMSSWGHASEVLTFQGTIDEFHAAFGGRNDFSYSQLEGRHDYIQWLFPSPERSRFNSASWPLSADEAAAIRSDPHAKERIRQSFLLITDFYGFEMVNDTTGELQPNEGQCESRFRNLNTPGNHNFMRISRIVNCLNETGWSAYSEPFLRALYTQAFVTHALHCCCDSFARFWMQLLPDWQAVARREFPEAVAWLERPQYPRVSGRGGGSGVRMAFAPAPRGGGRSGGGRSGGDTHASSAPAKPAPLGVCFWNYSDCTVDVYHGKKFVVSLVPGKKHGMYSAEGHEFGFMLPPTGEASPETFATWRATGDHSQQVIAEGSAESGLTVGAIVCHNTHPRFDEHRMKAIGELAAQLQREGKEVNVHAICELGSLQPYAGASLPRGARASASPPGGHGESQPDGQARLPFASGDEVKVYSSSSGGWHPGVVTSVVASASAAPGAGDKVTVKVEYEVHGEPRAKSVDWAPSCDTIRKVEATAD
jgi:hypothetical protein